MVKARRTWVSGRLPRLLLVVGLLLTAVPFAPPAAAATAWQSAGEMQVARAGHTMTMLPNGRVLVTGGADIAGGVLRYLASVEIYNPATGIWTARASMRVGRLAHTATLLNDGTVLVAGGEARDPTGVAAPVRSTEIYDPTSNTWMAGPDMLSTRRDHTAVLLTSGDVFIAGSSNDIDAGALAERYDPVAGEWVAAAPMALPRFGHTTTLLDDGSVLVAGGAADNSAERYLPNTNMWLSAGTMSAQRSEATATRLLNGHVLVAGGLSEGTRIANAERYDPDTNAWSPAGALATGRNNHIATILAEGGVMVVSGEFQSLGALASVEIYDPATNAWVVADPLLVDRTVAQGILLQDGSVLVSGGLRLTAPEEAVILRSAERFPPNQLPTVTRTPIQSLRLGTLRPTTVPVTTAWSAADADGISRYFLSRQRNAGAFASVPLADPQANSITQLLLPGGSHTYRLRAADGRGTRSALVAGPTATLDARNEAHASIAYTGTWNTASNPQFFGGAAAFASAAGARATISFTGTSVAWATSRGSNRGIAEVWLDGVRLATIDLFSPTTRVRQIMFARNGLTNSAHTLEIRVLGTRNDASTGTRVDVDAFVILR